MQKWSFINRLEGGVWMRNEGKKFKFDQWKIKSMTPYQLQVWKSSTLSSLPCFKCETDSKYNTHQQNNV